MQLIIELLSSGEAVLVVLGLLGLAGFPSYLYIKEIRRQRDKWKERWQAKKEKLQAVTESRKEEMRDVKNALRQSQAVNETLRDELQRARGQNTSISNEDRNRT